MSDPFQKHTAGLESPPSDGFAITPDDGADLPVSVRGLNVGVAGTVRLTTVKGSVITVSVAAGSVFPVRASKVWNSGTSASLITGLY